MRRLLVICGLILAAACSRHHDSSPAPTVQPQPCCHTIECRDFMGHNPRVRTVCLDTEPTRDICFVGDECFYHCRGNR